MREVKFNDVYILINLEAGLYVLPSDGASGKTYLGKLLQAARANGVENIAYITYDPDLSEQSIVEKMDLREDSVLLVDRFDLYKTKVIVSRLNSLSKNSVILVDVKNLNSLRLGNYRFAVISRMGENYIEVGL